ncbi:MAG: [FeFe] hydrogenase, group A [Candidatus Ancillula sp.]|jgi:NADH-quinone oxidoreductase subunit G|nr:[FeFe] hydrogenase, group A [Candidatus Ancillula sp.]
MWYNKRMVVSINGKQYEFNEDEISVVEFAAKNEVDIPTLCFLKKCSNIGKCGLCTVLVNGKKTLACKKTVVDGDEIVTTNPELDEALKTRVSKLLDNHEFTCGKCVRKTNCEFLQLVVKTRARANTPYKPTEVEKNARVDSRSQSLVLDRNKCVLCSRCVATCAFATKTGSIGIGKVPALDADGHEITIRAVRPQKTEILDDGKTAISAENLCFDETNCLLCGQCLLNCPVAALKEKSHIEQVEEALADPKKHVIVALAPAIRTALGEEFGLPIGTDVTGKIYTAIHDLGANKVFDIGFAADVTIVEEGVELLKRLGFNPVFDTASGSFRVEGSKTDPESDKLPMFTSCCPGWVRQARNYFPNLVDNLSSAKSPQQIFGALSKVYYPELEKVDAKSVYMVTIMPCIAKKAEAQIHEFTQNGLREIDAVLTTREFAQLIKKKKIKFTELEDSNADAPMGEYSGAGVIFGATGGVMEAAIRSAKAIVDGTDEAHTTLDYCEIRGLQGVKSAQVKIGGVEISVAVVNGAANFFEFQQRPEFNDYHFVEVMACSGGCVNGGGQPIISAKDQLKYISGDELAPDLDIRKLRAKVLYNQDKHQLVAKHRMSHENEAVLAMYKTLGESLGTENIHKMLHYHYK